MKYKLIEYTKNKNKIGVITDIVICILIEDLSGNTYKYCQTLDSVQTATILANEDSLATILPAIANAGKMLFQSILDNTPQPSLKADEKKCLYFIINESNGIITCTLDNNTPIISKIAFSNITYQSIIITWDTDKNTTTELEYGTTISYGLQAAPSFQLTNSHIVSLQGLLPNTVYHIRIKACDYQGHISLSSDTIVTTAPLSPDIIPPTVPSNVTITVFSSQQINCVWNASSDPYSEGQLQSGISKYRIYRNALLLAETAELQYSDMLVIAKTTYSYQISAVDNAGNESVKSNAITVTTP